MLPLFGEGHGEALLTVVVQRRHCLFDVVVVRLELLLKVQRLVSQSCQGGFHALEFALPLNSSSMLGSDVDCDSVQYVLVVVVSIKYAELFQP